MPKKYVHGVHVNDKAIDGDAIVACVQDVDTGEPSLQIVRNPKRPIFITRKGLRTHPDNKEYVPLKDVDTYMVNNYEMLDELKAKLFPRTRRWMSRQDLLNNPYVYGADVPIDVLMKHHYLNKTQGLHNPAPRVGALDIETSVLGGEEVIVNSYAAHDHTIYCSALKSFLKPHETHDVIMEKINKELLLFRDRLNDAGKKAYDAHLPKVVLSIEDHEVDVIRKPIHQGHKHKDTFAGIWNINFDIPYILKRLKRHNVSPESVFCHPDVPKDLQRVKYVPDKQTAEKAGHWSYLWHFFHCTGYTQWVDSQALYSRIRKFYGLEASYKLDYIAGKVIGTGKLSFDTAGHYIMQRDRFVEYIAYNIIDTLLVALLDKVTSDVVNLMLLTTYTGLYSFAQQTVQIRDWYYDYCKKRNWVSGCCAGNQTKETDKFIIKTGGGVLSPLLAKDTGTDKLEETGILTGLQHLVGDLDVASLARGYSNIAYKQFS